MGGLTTRARHIWRRVLHPELSAGLRTRILLALFEIRYPGPEIKYGRPRSGKGRPFNATRTLGDGGSPDRKTNMLQNRSVPQCSETRLDSFFRKSTSALNLTGTWRRLE